MRLNVFYLLIVSHVALCFNSHRKIPLALENSSSSAVTSSHRSSTNSLSSSSGFLSPSPLPPYSQSHDSKPTLSYGTTLNARVTSQRAGEQLAYSGSGSSRQVSSSSPQMPSAHLSSLPSTPGSNKSIKSRSGPKHFWVKEPPVAALASSSANNNSSSDSGGVSVSSSSSSSVISLSSTKKRKNSSLLKYSAESSPSSSSSSLKKNCMVNSGTSGSSFHSSLTSTASSVAFSSSSSSSSSHNAGMSCPPSRGNSMSARQEVAESIKRMSVMMNSTDSTLSLGPFVNNPDGRTDTKRRKSSQATSSLTGTAIGTGNVEVEPPSWIINSFKYFTQCRECGAFLSFLLWRVVSFWTVSNISKLFSCVSVQKVGVAGSTEWFDEPIFWTDLFSELILLIRWF